MRWSARRRAAVAALAALAWAISQAGVGEEILNVMGWSSFVRFWTAAAAPELAVDFLRLTLEASVVTLSYAVLGTALALLIGIVGAVFLSELLWQRGAVWLAARAFFVVPRGVHEILWALLLIQIFGFDPIVAVLAIGIPFGAVTAKVYAETIDSADPSAYRSLRARGAGRLTALAYGVSPTIHRELISYAFYRLECAVRSAAVLGVIGAGGLGYQLSLSFASLRYGEIWTLIVALMILSGLTDAWSSTVRRAGDPVIGRVSLAAAAALLPLSWAWVGLDISTLWSARTRALALELTDRLFPPSLGPGGWSELVGASVDTVAMSLLAIAIAVLGGLALGAVASRPTERTARPTLAGLTTRLATRLILLLFRAVPAPVWAFLIVLVLFPGLWPGAVALGIYNVGVLGRLFAEVIEDRDTRPSDSLALSGATGPQRLMYATFPAAAARLTSLGLYRWEVIVRETVVVGVVGAGGLGQLISEHLAARDFAAVMTAIIALIIICIAIDAASAALRRFVR